jgi:hypothetical protein
LTVQSHSVALDLEQWKLYKMDNKESMASQTLSLKPKEEPAVVALRAVVHESTSKLTSATGVMVHLFGGDLKAVMIFWIISFKKLRSFGREWRKYMVKTS